MCRSPGLGALLRGKRREVVKLSEMVFNGPFRVMVQRRPEMPGLALEDELIVRLFVIQPANSLSEQPQLVIGITTQSLNPSAIEIVSSREIVGHRPVGLR